MIVHQASVWEIAVHLAVASDVFDGVFLCCPFYNEMSWMRSGIELSQFLTVFFPPILCIDRALDLPEIPFSEIPEVIAGESLCWSSQASRVL